MAIIDLTPQIKMTIMMVSGASTVPVEMLLENDEFLEQISSGMEYEQLLDWVNENY